MLSQPQSAHAIPLILRYFRFYPQNLCFIQCLKSCSSQAWWRCWSTPWPKLQSSTWMRKSTGRGKSAILFYKPFWSCFTASCRKLLLSAHRCRWEHWEMRSSQAVPEELLLASAVTKAKYIQKYLPVSELSMFRWPFKSLLQVADIAETLLWNYSICRMTAGCASVVLLCHDTSGFDVLLRHFPHWFNQFTSFIFS